VQQQLLLALLEAPPPALDNFVPGANAAALAALRGFGSDPGLMSLYLWGGRGSGRSHLWRAWSSLRQGAYIDARAQPDLAGAPSTTALAVDNCDALSENGQITLFNLYNHARESGGLVLSSGPLPAAQLGLRDDLKSRLAWGLALEVKPLTDAEKQAALLSHAGARGMRLSDDIVAYMLVHVRRDMPTLMRLIDSLDTASLAAKRPVTLPLLRELLAESSSLPL